MNYVLIFFLYSLLFTLHFWQKLHLSAFLENKMNEWMNEWFFKTISWNSSVTSLTPCRIQFGMYFVVPLDLSGRHSSYPLWQACEWVEDTRQEDDWQMCGEHAPGRHCFDRRRTGLLRDGPGQCRTLCSCGSWHLSLGLEMSRDSFSKSWSFGYLLVIKLVLVNEGEHL